ncbi:hypothetical protein [Xanthomarina gelatinilytica]|uniref:hypothetical protein n=1 Tax=Xanthomarina gelatinilytica TaxID=1137281 RepID=UPI003AA7F21C
MNKVLKDHKQVGKKLQPPFLNYFDDWQTQFIEVSFMDNIVPEIIWLAFLNDKLGVSQSAELSLNFLKIIRGIRQEKTTKCFSFISDFEVLTKSEKEQILKASNHLLDRIKPNIFPLIKVFPKSPLNFLFSDIPEYNQEDVSEVKRILKSIDGKRNKESVWALGNIIYHLFLLDILRVTKESSLIHLPEIEKYPATELSRKVASAIRASIYPIIKSKKRAIENSDWQKYFWNRAFEIEPYVINNFYFD